MPNIKELESFAREATPGPWFVDEDPRPGMQWNRSIDTDHLHGHTVCFMTHSDGKFPKRDKATAEFIATCDPQTVLAFCEVVKAAINATDPNRPATENLNDWRALRRALSAFVEDGSHADQA